MMKNKLERKGVKDPLKKEEKRKIKLKLITPLIQLTKIKMIKSKKQP